MSLKISHVVHVLVDSSNLSTLLTQIQETPPDMSHIKDVGTDRNETA